VLQKCKGTLVASLVKGAPYWGPGAPKIYRGASIYVNGPTSLLLKQIPPENLLLPPKQSGRLKDKDFSPKTINPPARG